LVLKVEHNVSPAFAVIRVGEDNGGTIGLLPLQKVSLNPILAAMVRLSVWAGLRISNFKQIANSVSVAGDAARHGKEPYAPPRSPMLLPEAESLIAQLPKNWLRSKQR